MIKDFENLLTGNDVPVRSCKKFYQLGKSRIIRDGKARKILTKQTGQKYFGSFKEFTAYAAKKLERELMGRK